MTIILKVFFAFVTEKIKKETHSLHDDEALSKISAKETFSLTSPTKNSSQSTRREDANVRLINKRQQTIRFGSVREERSRKVEIFVKEKVSLARDCLTLAYLFGLLAYSHFFRFVSL
jgi:hypothetical protein